MFLLQQSFFVFLSIAWAAVVNWTIFPWFYQLYVFLIGMLMLFSTTMEAQLAAFPGAEGFGRFAKYRTFPS